MIRSASEPAGPARSNRPQAVRPATLHLSDPVLRRLLEQVANGQMPVTEAVAIALDYVDRHRQSDGGLDDVNRALSLADAALGAEGVQVAEPAVRELGQRVAEGRMTGDEAAAFIRVLSPDGATGSEGQASVATLDDRVGPFFDSTSLVERLRLSTDALSASVEDRDVLAVVTADGFLLYPAFQFNENGESLPRLREVLAELDPDMVDPWGDAVWLNAPGDDLDGLSPAAALRKERAEEVIRLAGQSAFRRAG